MIRKDISFDEPLKNILYDEVLWAVAERGIGTEVLRFWESDKPFIVLGRIGKPEEDIIIEQALRRNIPVCRRASGGGTVVQGKGCLNFSLILSKERDPGLNDIKGSYRFILGRVAAALKDLKVDAEFRPVSDLVVADGEKKISGNAQKRGRKFILHHGTILCDLDLGLVRELLRIPRSVPDYRRERSHDDFLANVHLPKERIMDAISARFPVKGVMNGLEETQLRHLEGLEASRINIRLEDFLLSGV